MALRTCVWGRLTTSSSWWAQIPWGLFLIALQSPSCSCFSAVTCDLKASEMTNGEVQKVFRLQPAEGEGNYDLNSQLPQYIFVFWSAGEKNLPFSPNSHLRPHIHIPTDGVALLSPNYESWRTEKDRICRRQAGAFAWTISLNACKMQIAAGYGKSGKEIIFSLLLEIPGTQK